ncbi:MAG: sel1 repeat family protein [Roseibium sp.]|uniref:tetratricopeptide repeat protein n=1 Tax=Roseibium sp. TaxID=1936156 RepID=UPI001B020902|nr:tetratricopeptide repeat protein [Roseibium sp.]MBO6507746.1 sel1 repeat family protein [Roseibium sp.]MBO6893125.1 sel1 repeat family protein [Roseibium sp.]MBO6932638.1 sel1 repeat family protein [Roseibium sp.]
MSKISKKQPLWKLMLLGSVFGLVGAVALSGNTMPEKSRSERIDPTIEEMIKQARGLQKVGRWEAAADLLTQLANDGHPVALYHLGRAFKNGWGVEADHAQSRLIFMEAARYSFAFRGETAYELGRLFQRSSGERCAEIALQWFHKALAWDYPKAHVQLAKHYERGIGAERDLAKAFHHYEKAAIAGYPSSTINYARILQTGRYGTVANPERAAFWASRAIEGLEKKARDGSASSAKTLGRIYRDGEFMAVDRDRAREWFLRSAELGDAGAMHDLGLMILSGTPSEADIQDSLKWLRLAAEAEHGGALTALGRLHLKQAHDLSEDKALDFLKRGVEVGHPGAMEELARLYATGRLVPQDRTKALDLAGKGADRGHQGSARLLKKLQEMDAANLSIIERSVKPVSSKKEG